MDTASESVLSEGNSEAANMREEGAAVRAHNDGVRKYYGTQIAAAKSQEKDDAGSEAKKKTYLEQGAELAGQVGGRARAVDTAMTKAKASLDPLGQGLEKAGVSGGEYAKAAFGQYMNDSETVKAGKAVVSAGKAAAPAARDAIITARTYLAAGGKVGTEAGESSGAAAQSGGEAAGEAAARGAPDGAVLTGRATDLGVGTSGRLAALSGTAGSPEALAAAKASGSAAGGTSIGAGGAEAAGDVSKLGKLAGYADVAARGAGIIQGGLDFIDDFDSHGHFQVKGNSDQKLGNELGMASGALDVASFFVPGAGLVAAGLGIASAVDTIVGDKKADETKADVTLPGKEKGALETAPAAGASPESQGLVGHVQQQATQKTGGASGAF